jgi:hypothetical protein
MPYVDCMILIVEESPEVITFENTRSGATFHAWLKEGITEWIVMRQGSVQTWRHADVWGRAEYRDGDWLGYAGNLQDTEPRRCKSRDDAFAWITDDRAEK